jgi:pyruvate-ferredoxin/flavodoxin oxidoreductase
MQLPLTPADFAVTEGRFKKHFKRLPEGANNGVPVHEFIDLKAEQREGKTPYVLTTNADKKLVKIAVSSAIVQLTEERRKYWRSLQYLAGLQVKAMDAAHRTEMETLQQRYKDLAAEREASLDSLAKAMAELASSSGAPVSRNIMSFGGGAPAPAAATPAADGNASNGTIVTLAESDLSECTNCKTCYQDLGELFEKTTITVDGTDKEVGHLKSGALEQVEVTPELKSRIAKVVANCDAEIIHND